MNRLAAAGAAAILAAIALGGADALAVDNFQKLKGSQIQARFAGMEMTVWISGKKVELRRGASTLPLEGVLQKPADRK